MSFFDRIGLLVAAALAAAPFARTETPHIIPRPLTVNITPGTFGVTAQTRVVVFKRNAGQAPSADYLARQLRLVTGFPVPVVDATPMPSRHFIFFNYIRDEELGEEGYHLEITGRGVFIEANGDAGFFYGAQTFLQMLPPAASGTTTARGVRWTVPCGTIDDQPRYGWRGMMLDVSRHFFPKTFVLNFIDALAMHKMNRFHWHLTDDQGWRIEIRRYPGLAATSAWRVDHEDVQWNARPAQKPGEAATYGGYYTQQEIREIVRYAADRFITVVPEIEMPAHVSAVLAAYPGLSCTGGPFTAPPGGIWPLKDILCAGNDSVFTFLQNVLTEVADLFPGPYIHIGGDEADKTEWRRCPKCQGRIAAEHLANEEELQSYFVHRVERILAGLGKKLIGWDEILEGGLAPDATVMSWRGTQGGIAAARQRHDVIMSPTSHCYFDYYQGDRSLEPIAIGGFIPLSTVYAFEPTPDSLTAEETGHILGVQANLWTEYIPTPEKAQYMIFPRIAAIAEVGWTARARRDWSDFLTRLPTYYERLDAHGTPAARSVYAVLVEDSLDAAAWKRIVRLTTECGMPGVRYTLDGSEPGPSSPVYGGPVVLDRTATIRAALFLNGRRAGPITNRTVYLGRKGIAGITLRTPFDPAKGGATGTDLLDGVRGPEWPYDRRWGGIEGSDFEAVIDLGGRVPVHAVTAGFLHEPVNMIFPPPRVEVALSDDGTTFATVDTVFGDTFQKEHRFFVRDYRASAGNAQARYVRVRAANPGPGPAWHKESGKPTWLYIDEIIVE